MNPCTVPVPPEDVVGDGRWISMHNRYVAETKTSEPEVIFIGDSIIQQLQFSDLWNEKINSLHCVNFGIGGDRVEHVLWRLKNGELDFSYPGIKAVVLFVGTNNNNCSPEQIVDGILECIETIKEKLGDVQIILPTLLPRGQNPNPLRTRNDTINKLLIEKFGPKDFEMNHAFPQNVHVVEIDTNIIQNDGTISHYILHDYLHLTNSGYTKIFEPVYKKLCELLNI